MGSRASSPQDYSVQIHPTPEDPPLPHHLAAALSDGEESQIEELHLSEATSSRSLGKPTPCLPNNSLSTSTGSSLRDLVGSDDSSFNRSLTASERHNSRRYSEVDLSMVRGVSLRRSLRGLGRLWRYDPAWKPQDRAALFELSSRVAFFNVFISHTWQTPGRWKIIALCLQCGWPGALMFWFVAVFTCFALCAVDILPMPLSYESTIFPEVYPMGFWILLASPIATLMGLLSAPYWPNRCSPADTGFIDVASIHQVDEKLMARGIYGIASFLSISQELRILFSGPYFSRLWCVFEVAAYKKVNPAGSITFRPVFFETVVVGLVLFAYCFCFIFLTWLVIDSDGQHVNAWAVSAFAAWVVPLSIATYGLRMIFRQKHHLLSELEEFDLDRMQCSKQFDRDFIHSAIVKWYGSKEAFTAYVRCDLKQELATTLFAAKLPREYVVLILTPFLSLCLEIFLANWKRGVPFEQLLSFCISILVGLDVFWIGASMLLMVYLCDHFAAPRFGSFDPLQTIAIICVVTGFVSVGTQLAAYAYEKSLTGSLAFLAATMLVAASLHCLEGKTRYSSCTGMGEHRLPVANHAWGPASD